MKIEKLKEKYKGAWLAIEVTEEDESGPIKGNLVFQAEDHDKLWEKISKDNRRIYVTYAGPLIEEGYAVAFHAHRS